MLREHAIGIDEQRDNCRASKSCLHKTVGIPLEFRGVYEKLRTVIPALRLVIRDAGNQLDAWHAGSARLQFCVERGILGRRNHDGAFARMRGGEIEEKMRPLQPLAARYPQKTDVFARQCGGSSRRHKVPIKRARQARALE